MLRWAKAGAAVTAVLLVFIGGGMAAASAQQQSMQQAMAAQARAQAELSQQSVQQVSQTDRCVDNGAGCSSGQGVTFSILPPGAPIPTTPPTTTPPGGGDDDGGGGGGGRQPVANPPTALPKTGPSAAGWTGIIGIALVQVGLVFVVRATRAQRAAMAGARHA